VLAIKLLVVLEGVRKPWVQPVHTKARDLPVEGERMSFTDAITLFKALHGHAKYTAASSRAPRAG